MKRAVVPTALLDLHLWWLLFEKSRYTPHITRLHKLNGIKIQILFNKVPLKNVKNQNSNKYSLIKKEMKNKSSVIFMYILLCKNIYTVRLSR